MSMSLAALAKTGRDACVRSRVRACVRARARACVRACVRARVCVCVCVLVLPCEAFHLSMSKSMCESMLVCVLTYACARADSTLACVHLGMRVLV